MIPDDMTKKTNDPQAEKPPNPASQPHGTTQDQINEMESEGQAMNPGQNPNPSARNTDEHKGAVEGDRASDKEQGNRNAAGSLNKDGLPKNKKAIAEDSIGARADETQG